MPRASSTSLALTVMSFCLAGIQSAPAADPAGSQGTHVAAAAFDNNPTRSSNRSVRGDGQRELELWLAQLPNTTSGEKILAGFPVSAPESVEEDVAKHHRLELVQRLNLESLGKRIVVFRVLDTRAVADVVAALKADHRVSSAQANVRYEVPEQNQPETQIGELKPSPEPNAKHDKKNASRSGRRIALPGRSHAKPQDNLKPQRATRTVAPIRLVGRAEQNSIVTRSHAALRWPTADEPFVNVGTTNK
jgi:hypothetical protein